ncbi:hypothetical protein H257_13242 [Aphanomyces astaci]|uniref:Uncharacterized protein n=1 Tax=Aphanomyces astaci TaxID=112090 RepID=W4FY54_APHAT|nr:hypothetical protein H257_13242 [Aphanomyces astaci]ETV71573.1 hypothetical protein H257_13242 [Aphanomyces astaci]|eukprot:XP_009839006.1 hypothetical protein H257_13242 [Aphanomyces astaci]
MTFTTIATGAVPMVAAPDPSGRETATQRRRRQREASLQRRFQVYEDRLSSNRNGRNERPYYDDRPVAVIEAAAVHGLPRVKMTSAAAHTRHQCNSKHRMGSTTTTNPQRWMGHGYHYATPAASPEAVAVPASSQIAEVDAVPAPEEVAQVIARPLQVDVLAAGDDDLVVAPLEGGN